MATTEAIAVALELIYRPGLVHAARNAPLPRGISLLLEIAAGEASALRTAMSVTGRSERFVRHAAEFFIEQVLFDPAADSFRVLGVHQDTHQREIRRHMALLARWLHPDVAQRSASGVDRSLFAPRVTRAWEDLKRGRPTSVAVSRTRTKACAKPNTSPPSPQSTRPPKTSRTSWWQRKQVTSRAAGKQICMADGVKRRRRHKRLVMRHLGNDTIMARVLGFLKRSD